MKLLMIIYCLIFGPLNLDSVFAKRQAQKYIYPVDNAQTLHNSIQRISGQTRISSNELKRVKHLILNGRTEVARIVLENSVIQQNSTRLISLRYLAIIYFIQGNYKEVIKTLSDKAFDSIENLSKVCTLKLVSLMALDKIHANDLLWKNCREATSYKSVTNLLWLRNLVALKQKKKIAPLKGIAIDNEKGDYLRAYLKLALYLQKQDKIIPRFEYFGPDILEDTELRELIGLNYFRNGELVKAYQYLEDLTSPNAEVFKGNIYLFQSKFELAFAQYKLALAKKNNSQNAIERIVPVAWKLQQWQDGIKYIKRLEAPRKSQIEKLTLLALFQTMNNSNRKAQKTLNKILNTTQRGQHTEVNQLLAINSLLNNSETLTEQYSMSSCEANDGLNCWLLFQTLYWEKTSMVLQKKDLIHQDLQNLVDKYQSKPKLSLNHIKYIDQTYIEELDNHDLLLAK